MNPPAEWTTPRLLKEKLTRLWDRGDILSLADTPDARWRLPIRGPDSAALLEYFEAARNWTRSLETSFKVGGGVELEWKEINHRQLGQNRIPSALWVNSPDAAAAFLHQTHHLHRFRLLKKLILEAQPDLAGWIQRRPHKVLETDAAWPGILSLLTYLKLHPRPNIYVRQIDLGGVHTKFVEQGKGLVVELAQELHLTVDETQTTFEKRFGFLTKPALVRFRFLDPNQRVGWENRPLAPEEWSLRSSDFAQLEPEPRRVLIVENEITWLALPELRDTLAIWGSGYGFDSLKEAHWLQTRRVLYWSDLDTHGFGMLDQLRAVLPQTESILMDKRTLEHHKPLWTQEPTPLSRELPRLTLEERELYLDLAENRVGERVRLEQERIGFGWITDNLRERLG